MIFAAKLKALKTILNILNNGVFGKVEFKKCLVGSSDFF